MNIHTSSSTENTSPWATLKFVPSDLRASAVTQPGALVLSPLVVPSGSDKPLGTQDGNSFGLNLKASWEDSLTSFISIKMHFLSCSWRDLPLQPSWRGGCTSYDVFTLLKCHSQRLSLNITRMLITGKLGTSGLKSLLSFPFFIFSSDVQASLQLLPRSVLCSNQTCSSVYL